MNVRIYNYIIIVFFNNVKPFFVVYTTSVCFMWKSRIKQICNQFIMFLSQAEDMQQQIIRETFHLVSKRDDNVCNFLEGGRWQKGL